MLRGCAEIPGVEVEETDDVRSPRGTGSPSSFAGGTVQEVLNSVKLRNHKNMAASNAAIESHIGSLAERLSRVEKEQDSSVQRQLRATRAEDKTAQETEYCNYSEFIATTQTNLNCVGVHTWSMCAATRGSLGRGGVCFLLPSAALLAFQCFVLVSISLGSFHPTCVRNEDCRVGMWCAPSTSPGGDSRFPGMCDDCGWASKLDEQDYRGLPSRYNEDAHAALTEPGLLASETLAAAVSHCDASDTELERCDFVMNFRSELTLGPLLVLAFVTSLVLVSLVADMDKQAQASDVFVHRLSCLDTRGCGTFPVASGACMIFTLRRFVLPGVAAYAYATLLLTGPTAQGRSLPLSFVLAGLVVGFVCNVDRLLALTLLGENAQADVREAFAEVEAKAGRLRAPRQCILHRLFAGCLGLLIMVQLLATETMMDAVPLFSLDWGGMPERWASNTSPMSCTNVASMLGTTTVVMVVFFAFVWSVLHAKSAFDGVISTVVALLAMPVLSFIVLRVGYSPIP